MLFGIQSNDILWLEKEDIIYMQTCKVYVHVSLFIFSLAEQCYIQKKTTEKE